MTTEQMDWLDDHNPKWQARLRREREQRLELRRVLQEQGYLIKTVTGEMVWHAWDCTGGYDFVECIPRCKQGRSILAATEGGE